MCNKGPLVEEEAGDLGDSELWSGNRNRDNNESSSMASVSCNTNAKLSGFIVTFTETLNFVCFHG